MKVQSQENLSYKLKKFFEEIVTDQPTDRPTDQPTRRTERKAFGMLHFQ